MATCKWCNRSGWFLSLSEQGLCKTCHPAIAIEASQRARVLLESDKIAQQTAKLDTAVSRYDLAIEHAQALERFERRDIETINPPPSSMLRTLRDRREALIASLLEKEVEAALQKVAVLRGTTAKVNALSNVLLRVQAYIGKVRSPQLLAALEKTLKDHIQATHLGAFLEAARKAEFKGETKKALDAYYDALYFLKHDDIDDARQAEHIQMIEQKILAFGGEVK